METENKVFNEVLEELEEAERIDMEKEEGGALLYNRGPILIYELLLI